MRFFGTLLIIAMVGGTLWVAPYFWMMHVSNGAAERYQANQAALRDCLSTTVGKGGDDIDRFMDAGNQCAERIAHGGATN